MSGKKHNAAEALWIVARDAWESARKWDKAALWAAASTALEAATAKSAIEDRADQHNKKCAGTGCKLLQQSLNK